MEMPIEIWGRGETSLHERNVMKRRCHIGNDMGTVDKRVRKLTTHNTMKTE